MSYLANYQRVRAQLFGFYEALERALEVEDADASMYYQVRIAVLEAEKNRLGHQLEMEEIA